jgi:hypothetical protein
VSGRWMDGVRPVDGRRQAGGWTASDRWMDGVSPVMCRRRAADWPAFGVRTPAMGLSRDPPPPFVKMSRISTPVIRGTVAGKEKWAHSGMHDARLWERERSIYASLSKILGCKKWRNRFWDFAKDIWEIRCEVFQFELLPDALVTTNIELPYLDDIDEFIEVVKKRVRVSENVVLLASVRKKLRRSV